MENKMKTINITEKTWRKINKDKYELGFKTHEEVILSLYQIVTKIKRGDKNADNKFGAD